MSLWKWLKRHHQALSAVSAIAGVAVSGIVGVAGIYVAQGVKQITASQTLIAKRAQEPIISIRVEKIENGDKSGKRLSAYNTGAAIQHLRLKLTTLLIVGHQPAVGKEDDVQIVLPVRDFYDTYDWTRDDKGRIFLATSEDNDNVDRFKQFVYQVPPGKGFHEFHPRRTEDLLRVKYENLLGESVDAFYLINDLDYVRLGQDRAVALLAAVDALAREHEEQTRGYGLLSMRKHGMQEIYRMARSALMRPALHVAVHVEDADTSNTFAY